MEAGLMKLRSPAINGRSCRSTEHLVTPDQIPVYRARRGKQGHYQEGTARPIYSSILTDIPTYTIKTVSCHVVYIQALDKLRNIYGGGVLLTSMSDIIIATFIRIS